MADNEDMDEMEDIDENSIEVPEGTAIFPEIPDQVGANPLLLSLLHFVVFIAGSDKNICNQQAGAAILDQVATYLQRLNAKEVARLKEDLAVLAAFAREEKWGGGTVEVLDTFLDDMGVGDGE